MQTQSACLQSLVVLSEAVTSLAWPVIFEYQRTKVVGNGLRNLRISHPRTRCSKCISVEWNHLLRDIWCWREKNRSGTFPLLGQWPSYSPKECCILALLFIAFSELIFSLTAAISSYICRSRLTLELLGLLNFALRLSLPFTSVIFLSKLWFFRFLVLARVTGVSTSPESCTSFKAGRNLMPT